MKNATLAAALLFTILFAMLCAPQARAQEQAYQPLLITDADITRMQRNIDTLDWAHGYFENMKSEVDAWRDKELEIPEKGGGWSHNYIAPDTGRRLKYDRNSPHKHLDPSNGTYHEGPLLDAAWRESTHKQNILLAFEAALLYRLTGDAWYAQFARSVLVRYARAYHTYPPQGGPAGLGRITAQALGEAVWNIHAMGAFDLLAPTTALSEKDKKNIIKKLFVPAARHVSFYQFGIHNIQVWECVSMLLAGLLADDKPLLDTAREKLDENMAQGIRPEGLWFETSVGYHFYVMQPFEVLATVCSTRGLNFCAAPRFKALFTALPALAMPDATLPALNDGGPGSDLADNLRGAVAARHAFNDPALDPLINTIGNAAHWKDLDIRVFLYYIQPQGEVVAWEPPRASVHMPGSGLTALRRNGRYALLKYNPASGGHDHPDRLGIIYHTGARQLYPDLGTTAYGHPFYKEWYKTTEGHNTLMADAQQQARADGCQALNFKDEPAFTSVSARCPTIYGGITAARTLILTDNALIDITHAASDSEHTYDWFLHADAPQFAAQPGAQPCPMPSPNQHMSLLGEQQPGAGPHTVVWEPGDDSQEEQVLYFQSEPRGTTCRANVPGFFPDQVMPAIMTRIPGRTATLAAATVPAGTDPPQFEISEKSVSITDGDLRLTVDLETGAVVAE